MFKTLLSNRDPSLHNRVARPEDAGQGVRGLRRFVPPVLRDVGVRSLLWAYGFLSLLAWGGGAFQIAHEYGNLREQLVVNVRNTVHLTAQQTAISLAQVTGNLEGLLTRLEETDWWVVNDRSGVAAEQQVQLSRTLQQMEQISALPHAYMITDEAGAVRITGHQDQYNASALSGALLAKVQAAAHDRLLVEPAPLDGLLSGPSLLFIRGFLKPDGTYGGAIVANVPLAALADLYRPLLHTRGDSVLLARADGQVLLEYPDARPLHLADGLAAPWRIDPRLLPDMGYQAIGGIFDDVQDRAGHVRSRAYASQAIPRLGLVSIVDHDLRSAFSHWIERTAWTVALAGGLYLLLTSAVIGMARQVRKVATGQQTLLETRDRLTTFFEGAQEGIVLSERGMIIDVNAAFERITGLPAGDVIGRPMLWLVHPDDLIRAMEAASVSPGPRVRLNIRSAGGRWTPMEIQGRTLSLNSSVRLSTCHDISHIVEQEEQLTALVADLKRSNRDLEQFAYVASHDLQEPLRTISSYVGLLRRRYGKELNGDAQDFMGYIVAGAHRMQALIRDLLDYSRVGTNGGAMVPVDAAQLVAEARENLRIVIADHNAVITVGALPQVLADRVQIVRLFQNLISNALKYHAPERPPCVQISAQRRVAGTDDAMGAGALWEFRIRDNGIGIPKKHAEQVFVIFQRLHGMDDYEGTGIGLAVARRIVERHGGTIWINTDAEQPGTEVCFTLHEASYDSPYHGSLDTPEGAETGNAAVGEPDRPTAHV